MGKKQNPSRKIKALISNLQNDLFLVGNIPSLEYKFKEHFEYSVREKTIFEVSLDEKIIYND